MGESINQVVEQFESELPLGMKVGVVAFQPEVVDSAIKNFLINLGESILIVVAVLWVFMGLKSASIVGTSLLLTIFADVYLHVFQ